MLFSFQKSCHIHIWPCCLSSQSNFKVFLFLEKVEPEFQFILVLSRCSKKLWWNTPVLSTLKCVMLIFSLETHLSNRLNYRLRYCKLFLTIVVGMALKRTCFINSLSCRNTMRDILSAYTGFDCPWEQIHCLSSQQACRYRDEGHS